MYACICAVSRVPHVVTSLYASTDDAVTNNVHEWLQNASALKERRRVVNAYSTGHSVERKDHLRLGFPFHLSGLPCGVSLKPLLLFVPELHLHAPRAGRTRGRDSGLCKECRGEAGMGLKAAFGSGVSAQA